MKPVTIIGIGLSPDDLTKQHLSLIEKADVLVGGRRHLDYFPTSAAEKKIIGKNLNAVLEFIREEMPHKSIAVLASGDPLFYGIGAYLARSLGKENIRILPNITSIAAAFSRIRIPWHDARLISLHGRFDEGGLKNALRNDDTIGLLTDLKHDPSWLAEFMQSVNAVNFDICVLEQMGSDSEKIEWFSTETAVSASFSHPNVVILIRKEEKARFPRLFTGMPEDAFVHERGLITKPEVRAVSISKLRLDASDLVMWDLGAGSGSVSIEAARFLPDGKIFAVEKNPGRIPHIQANKKRFGIHQLEIIHSELPNGLDTLPPPDRVFIGGGGKNLGEVIKTAAKRLNPRGIIVANTVLLDNLLQADETLTVLGFQTETVQIQVSVSKVMPWGKRLQSQNPIWIVSGYRA